MRNVIISLAFGLLSTTGFADGFLCQTDDGELNVKVYNHVQAENGTRVAAVMVISDPAISQGRKTIAVFRDSTLDSNSSTYSARVDLRFNESGRGGELIAGTKLAQLKSIDLSVDFSYAQPLAAGEVVDAMLYLTKRSGAVIERSATCERYLKN